MRFGCESGRRRERATFDEHLFLRLTIFFPSLVAELPSCSLSLPDVAGALTVVVESGLQVPVARLLALFSLEEHGHVWVSRPLEEEVQEEVKEAGSSAT